jgi:hypothetical protein
MIFDFYVEAASQGISNVELGGTFSDPHHGESFGRVTISGYAERSSEVSSLSADMRDKIDLVERFMKRDRTILADIIGHTDNSGNVSANSSVSLQRAQKLKQVL